MLEGLARFQEYTVRYGWEMCFPWYVRLVRLVDTVGTVGWHGWYRLLVRLNRTNRSQKPYQWTVPPYRTRLGGGSRGGAFWMYQYHFSIGTSKTPPLDPPLNLVRYGGTVHWYGWYGRYPSSAYQAYLTKRTNCTDRTVPSVQSVPTLPYQAYQA